MPRLVTSYYPIATTTVRVNDFYLCPSLPTRNQSDSPAFGRDCQSGPRFPQSESQCPSHSPPCFANHVLPWLSPTMPLALSMHSEPPPLPPVLPPHPLLPRPHPPSISFQQYFATYSRVASDSLSSCLSLGRITSAHHCTYIQPFLPRFLTHNNLQTHPAKRQLGSQ